MVNYKLYRMSELGIRKNLFKKLTVYVKKPPTIKL